MRNRQKTFNIYDMLITFVPCTSRRRVKRLFKIKLELAKFLGDYRTIKVLRKQRTTFLIANKKIKCKTTKNVNRNIILMLLFCMT